MELHILDFQVNFDLENSKLKKKMIIQGRGLKLSLNISMADHYSNPTLDQIIFCNELEIPKVHLLLFN